MSSSVVVQKGRTTKLEVQLGYSAATDTFTSEIRTEADQSAPLIAAWTITKPNGGTDGLLLLTLDDTISGQITQSRGYMDLKRVSGGEPLAVFDRPVEVLIRGTVTN